MHDPLLPFCRNSPSEGYKFGATVDGLYASIMHPSPCPDLGSARLLTRLGQRQLRGKPGRPPQPRRAAAVPPSAVVRRPPSSKPRWPITSHYDKCFQVKPKSSRRPLSSRTAAGRLFLCFSRARSDAITRLVGGYLLCDATRYRASLSPKSEDSSPENRRETARPVSPIPLPENAAAI